VKAIKDPTGSIPSWVGEEIPVPFEIGQEVGSIRRFAEEESQSGKSEDDIVASLCKKYPAGAETMRAALAETFEQISSGFALPTDRRIVVEDWEDFAIVNAHFGLMVNRTLARLIGHVLSEELGMTIGVQQDPYRMVIQTAGAANAAKVAQVLQNLKKMDTGRLVSESSKKTGLFKRRLVHVARRFGAITRWVEFGSVNMKQLMRSFEGTAIMEEALKETLEKDLDVPNTIKVLQEIGDVMQLQVAGRTEDASPIARIGIERISRKTDLIPPEKMKRILLESTKVRILNESRTLVCSSCLKYAKIVRIKDMPSGFSCPKCKVGQLGLSWETPEFFEKIQRKKGRNLSESEERIVDAVKESAALLKKHGKVVAYVMAGRRIGPGEAKVVLRRNSKISDRLYQAIMDAERRVLRKRFW
jgi:ATP-dependent Lhr-like helicase